jgi:hypothetical protein
MKLLYKVIGIIVTKLLIYMPMIGQNEHNQLESLNTLK